MCADEKIKSGSSKHLLAELKYRSHLITKAFSKLGSHFVDTNIIYILTNMLTVGLQSYFLCVFAEYLHSKAVFEDYIHECSDVIDWPSTENTKPDFRISQMFSLWVS